MLLQLTPEQADKLKLINRRTQDALSLLSVDMTAEGCTLDKIVDVVKKRSVGLISIVNTGLQPAHTRRDTAWPLFNQIRHDGLCGGLILQFHSLLKVQELHSLASTEFPGLWISVAGSPVQGSRNERITVVGIFSCDKVTGLEEYLASSIQLVKERFGPEVEVVVGGNQTLIQTETTPSSLLSLTWSSPGSGQFLLYSPSLPLQPQLVTSLGAGAILGSLQPTGCPVCNVGFRSEAELLEHYMKSDHKKNIIVQSFQQERPKLKQNPHPLGLEVSLVGDFPTILQKEECLIEVVMEPGKKKEFELQLRNIRDAEADKDGSVPGIVVEKVGVPDHGGVIQLHDTHGVTGDTIGGIRIRYPRRYKIKVICSSAEVGEHKFPIVVTFYHDTFSEPVSTEYCSEARKSSRLVVDVVIKVQTTEIVAMLPLEPYVQRPLIREREWRVKETVKGHIPACVYKEEADFLATKIPLGSYPLNETMRKLIKARFQGRAETVEEQEQLIQARNLLDADLNGSNYADKFSLLLHCEQWTEEQDVRYFDMADVEMKVDEGTGLVILPVPGLLEQRPSVLRGDKLYISRGGGRRVEYEAFVHEVRSLVVWLGCGDRFVSKVRPGIKWDVRFAVSLSVAKHMHRAVKLAQSSGLTTSSLFPDIHCLNSSMTRPRLSCYNPLVAANPEQRAAVEAIVSGMSGTAPYIVFGPPGTGKTVTLVEAIKQVWLHRPDTSILATAPSNTAADLLAERLVEDVSSDEIVRIHANSRARSSVPSTLDTISNLRDDGYWFPAMETLSQYRIIVTTLVTAGRLVSANFPANHFGYIFIDEAGQATEPETVIALAGLVTTNNGKHAQGQIVMAGDPQQLGPVVRSTLAAQHGLSVSLIERLMCSPLYLRGNTGYNHRCITKLIRNFRCHPALLRLPARLYYCDELLPCADRAVVEACLQSCVLTHQGRDRTPLVVHGVVGQDMREAASPSFFNPVEVVVVLDYIAKLMEEGVNPGDIGVIAPYRRQVLKLRERLGQRGWREHIDVGTTEEFQGQEKKVIIVSTVRSSGEYLSHDSQHKLGFLFNSKRFNVAISRARALLIVVGNPHILDKDPDWRELLNYAIQLGCYKGCPHPQEEREGEEDQRKEHLASLLLDQAEQMRLEETGWDPRPV